MKYKFVLGLDPSGNFHEGKGTTGCCLFDTERNCIIETKSIYANAYNTQHDYWHAVLMYVMQIAYKYKSLIVVIEDYMLYATKASAQINSKMETPKLIGILEYYCQECDIPTVLQPAHMVKNRWANEVLLHKNYIIQVGRQLRTPKHKAIDRHVTDAIRHAVHYSTFKNKER